MTYDEMSPTRLDLTGTFGLRVADRDVAEVRVGTLGRWGQRVNLATNPSFESLSGSTVVVRTNLATSPQSYTPAESGPHPGLTVGGAYTGSAEIDGTRQAIDPLNLVAGTTYVRLLIESGTVPLGDYFDGDTSPDPDLTPAWTGAVGASTSTLSGAAVAGAGGGYGEHTSAKIGSGQWGVSGSRSMRIIPTGTGNDTHGHFAVGLISGRTYRVSAVARLAQPQTGTLFTDRARRIQVLASSTWGPMTAAAPNEPGEHRLAGTFTGTFTGTIRLYNGASRGNGDVWYDDLLIEDVTDLAAQWSALPDPKPALDAWLDERLGTDAWDGDSPNTARALFHWTGPRHGSTSVQTLAWSPE